MPRHTGDAPGMRPDASLSYKNATMKHLKIMACLLLLGCMAPATALCAGEHAPKRSRGKGHDRPYSETMYVKRQGGDLYISAKLDERTDITYWFRRCMFNELYTFYRVGITRNRAALPTTQPEAEPAVLLNSTYSDNIGPFAIPGCGWCGGNHKYRERTARTARSEGYTLLADGNRIEGDTTLWANRVTVEAENVILDPTRPYRNAAGGEELRDTLCRESVTYTVRRNNIEVAASHRFCNAAPVTIAIYYGMQSMFEGETHVLTPGGAYTDWTEAAKASTFTKQEYPLFRRYVEKNRQGYQSTWLLPDGLGDHALLDGQDDIFIYAPYGKSYHKLFGNKRIKNGDKTCWRGVYTWFETPIADDADLLCYEGSAGGHTAVFIDCKRACKRTLALPGYLDLRHFGTAEQNGGIRISAAGRNKLKIKAGAPGSCVLLLRE